MSDKAEPKPVEHDVRRVAEKYDECAAFYAEKRAEAAEEMGHETEARHWDEVEERLSPDDDDD